MSGESKHFAKRTSCHLCGVLRGTCYAFLLYILLVLQDVSAQKSKILLRDIEALTFHDGSYTDHRRVPPVEQLKCVGGTAANYKEYKPRAVQCYNTGFDGRGVQWKCNAELSKAVRFGRLDVNCEGYDFPEDKYVLAGSCALRYELDFTKERFSDPKTSVRHDSFPFSGFIAVFCFLAVAVAVWYYCIHHVSVPEFESGPRVRPTAPPHPDSPPSYDDAMRGDHSTYPGESAYRETRFRGPASSTGYGWNVGDGYCDSTSDTSFWPRWRKPHRRGPASDSGSSYWATGASAFAGSFLGSSLFGTRGSNCPGNRDLDPPRFSSDSGRRKDRSSSGERDRHVATGYATSSGR